MKHENIDAERYVSVNLGEHSKAMTTEEFNEAMHWLKLSFEKEAENASRIIT